MCSNDAVHILEIIEYIALFYICIIDIRKKIIPDRGFIILVIIVFAYSSLISLKLN